MRTFSRFSARPLFLAMAAYAAIGLVPVHAAPAPRIKDIVDVENVRGNQLVGYGLVVGLPGTGDRIRNTPFTEETMQAMLERMGVNIRGTTMRTQNVAAVSVTATMPPFARSGSKIDVQVSALGDATSLQGGTLLVSSLRALDGEIYAVAQGPVAVSGFKATGAAASVTRGVPTTARIAGGAIIEREVPYSLRSATTLKLALKNPDFTTANRIAQVINGYAPGTAEVLDPATVEIAGHGGSVVDLMAQIENLSVSETPVASQPEPCSDGKTTVLPRTRIDVDDGSGRTLQLLEDGASLRSLVAGLNKLGVSPRDLITILQALRTAGALQAEIEVQ